MASYYLITKTEKCCWN